MLTIRLFGGVSKPLKYFFKTAIPELIQSSESSSNGINDDDGKK